MALSDPIHCRRCNTLFLRARKGTAYCDACRSSCAVDGCGKEPQKNGFCGMHNSRLRDHGELGGPDSSLKARGGLCAVGGCEGTASASGLCNMHYKRMRRIGTTGGPQRRHALIGTRIDAKGYRYVRIDGVRCQEHRYVMQKALGRALRPNENVHHLDGDRLNNDLSNLELWVKTQPSGQRVTDRVKSALKLLRDYPDLVAQEGFHLITLESQEATDLLEAAGTNQLTDELSAL